MTHSITVPDIFCPSTFLISLTLNIEKIRKNYIYLATSPSKNKVILLDMLPRELHIPMACFSLICSHMDEPGGYYPK